jgi:iron(III) transport system substrate-binding protein
MDPGEVFNLVKTGLVDPYRSPSRQGIMEEFMDKEGYWTAFYHLTMVLGYNPKLVKKEEAPKSYEEVLDSKWKGKISLDTDDVNVMGTLLDYWGKEKGLAYYRKLAENDPVIRRGKNLQAQILSAGDVSVAPFLYGFQPLLLKQKGAPVEINLLNPTLSSPSYLVLLKNASHPHAAALFLDWALSQEGPMRILTEEFGRGVPRSGYKERYPELSVSKYLATAPEKIGPFYQEYRKTYCEIFKHC